MSKGAFFTHRRLIVSLEAANYPSDQANKGGCNQEIENQDE